MLRQQESGSHLALRDPGKESLGPPLSPYHYKWWAPPPTPSFLHLLGLIDSRGTWTLARESSVPFMGLPWDWKAGGWKRGLPGPGEKGRRGLAVVPVGIRGEVVGPGKMEDTGFTRPEVLRGTKGGQVRDQGKLLDQPFTRPPGHGWFLLPPPHPPSPDSKLSRQKKHPQTLWSCLRFCQTRPNPPHLPLITLSSLQEADRGHPAGAGCYRPKLSHGTRGLWTQSLGQRLGPVQLGTRRSLLAGQEHWLGAQEPGKEKAAEPGSCLQKVLRAGQEARLRGCRQHSQAWGCRSPGPTARSVRRGKCE